MHSFDSVEERRLQELLFQYDTSIVRRSNGLNQVVDLSMMVLIYIVCLHYPMALYSSTYPSPSDMTSCCCCF